MPIAQLGLVAAWLGAAIVVAGGGWWALLAPVGYGSAFLAGAVHRTAGIGALLLAPIVVLGVTPVPSILDWRMALGLVSAAVAFYPLLVALGGRVPWNGLWALAPIVLVLPIFWSPLGPAFTASDVATRGQIVLIVTAALIVLSVIPKPRRGESKSLSEGSLDESAQNAF